MKNLKPKLEEKWIEEFDKKFVRDDGLMNKYYFVEGEEFEVPAEKAIKHFISNLLKERKYLKLKYEKMFNMRYKNKQ